MILRVGLDVVEVDRIACAMTNKRFLPRILTEEERLICTTSMRVAGRWAAKEAIAKTLEAELSWLDVEVLPDSRGAPSVSINPRKFDSSRMRIHLSISHERGLAAAVAVLESIG